MSLLTVLLFVPHILAQQAFVPLDPRYLDDASTTSTICVKRSAFIYTSASSTYVVTDIGILASTPTFCVNVSTVTVYQQQYTAPVINGFEAGNANGFNTSSSSSGVTAEVVGTDTGPLQPYSGDSYLWASPHWSTLLAADSLFQFDHIWHPKASSTSPRSLVASIQHLSSLLRLCWCLLQTQCIRRRETKWTRFTRLFDHDLR